MATYIEDLVQNIYTNCDMKGLDDLNQGLRDAIWYSSELEQNLRRANQAQRQGFDFHSRAISQSKEAYTVEKYRLALQDQENRYRLRLNEMQTKFDEQRQYRQDRYNKSLSIQNKLWRMFGRFALGWFGLRTLKNIYDTGSRLQLVQKSIEGLTKSTQDWKFLQDEAFKTGTDIEVVAKGYRNFYSAAKMAGFDKSGIQQMYADVLLSTRAIGATTQQTEGALLALEQMISKGTVSMEELRRQLGNALPGAFEIGAKAMNMTTMEFNKFVRTGKLASAEFVPKFIQALKDTYASGFKDIEQTVSVAQIRLSNAWKELTAEIISGETGKALAEGLNLLAEIIRSPEFKLFVQILGQIFAFTVRIVKFLLEHLPFILMLLGVLGINGALIKIIGHLVAIQLMVFQTTGAVITLGQAGVASFNAMAASVGTFLKAFIPLITLLLVIEDLVFFIGEKLFGWKVNSLTGAILARKGEGVGRVNLNKNIIPTSGIDQEAISRHVDKLAQQGKFDEITEYAKGLRGGFDTYSGMKMIQPQGMMFEQDASQKIDVRIENVNIGNGLDMSQVEQAGHLFGNSLTNTLYETAISKGGAKGLMGSNYAVTPVQGAKTMLGN